MTVLFSLPMRLISLIVILAFTVLTAAAQKSFAVGLFVGSNEFDEDVGRETYVGATGGVGYTTGYFLLTADLEADFIARDDPGSPYYFDSSADRCRDSRNGQFASSSLCNDGTWGGAATADASVIIPGADGLSAGVGFRLGSGSTPYITLGYALGGYQATTIRFKVQGFQHLVSFGAVFQFGS